MAKITTTKTHTSGIALGGIGSGSVELLPDGQKIDFTYSDGKVKFTTRELNIFDMYKINF